MRTLRSFILVCIILLGMLIVSPFSAQAQQAGNQWAIDMFDHTTHDFGSVARGATVEHIFTLENIYNEDIVIESITSTCGCTSAAVSTQRLKTWEKAKIKAIVDTRRYTGQKDATLKVRFAPPYSTEVLLHVHTFIRSDVVLQPGAIDFGKVKQGEGAKATATLSYDGSPNWAVQAVSSTNPYVSAVLKESQRNGGYVSYDMEVKLNSSAPAGYIRDQLVIVTNDPNPRQSRVPVSVQGLVIPSIAVHPNPLLMGVVDAGNTTSHRLVIQSQIPFRILAINATDRRFRCQASPDSKKVHLVNVQFDAKESKVSESIDTSITIRTDLEGEDAAIPVPISLRIVAQVEPTPQLPGSTPGETEPGILEPAITEPVPLPVDPPQPVPAEPTPTPTPGTPGTEPGTTPSEPQPVDPSTEPPLIPPTTPEPQPPVAPAEPAVEPSDESATESLIDPAIVPPIAPPIAPPANDPEPAILPETPSVDSSSDSSLSLPAAPPTYQADQSNSNQSELIIRL